MGKVSNSNSARCLRGESEGSFEPIAKVVFSSKHSTNHRGTYWGDSFWTPTLVNKLLLLTLMSSFTGLLNNSVEGLFHSLLFFNHLEVTFGFWHYMQLRGFYIWYLLCCFPVICNFRFNFLFGLRCTSKFFLFLLLFLVCLCAFCYFLSLLLCDKCCQLYFFRNSKFLYSKSMVTFLIDFSIVTEKYDLALSAGWELCVCICRGPISYVIPHLIEERSTKVFSFPHIKM